jgi:hypothetical protein
MAKDFSLPKLRERKLKAQKTTEERRKDVFNAANAWAIRRNMPVTLPEFKFAKAQEEQEHLCWGDYYRKHVYKREWFPIHPDDLREMEAARSK